jgi:NADH dehydrogenase
MADGRWLMAAVDGLCSAYIDAMRVLVTGGTGVVGARTVDLLVANGHLVRLVSRNAEEDSRRWASNVEPRPGNIADATGLKGVADDCDLVLHIAGIVAESPPKLTYTTVNVDGTRNIIREAERARVGRFIYISSLGADTGKSDYHRSKREGEEIAKKFNGGWIVLRLGNVFGPGDEVVSLVLNMMRTSPAIPMIDAGADRFQPIWIDDAAKAIAAAVERPDLHGRVLELAGGDVTSMDELLGKMEKITGRHPVRIPIPGFLARAGAALADAAGVSLPVSESQITMLREGNVIRSAGGNALVGVFRITPTPLDVGLKILSESQPEQLPEEGIGALEKKRIWVDIVDSKLTPEELFAHFCLSFDEVTPGTMDASIEPGSRAVIEDGATLTMALPLRGTVQVRANEVTGHSATLVTLKGHPLAGAVRFLAEQRGECVRFEAQVYHRAANVGDWILMNTLGGFMQTATWVSLVERMIHESRGKAPRGVQQESEILDDEQSRRVDEWLRELTNSRRAREAATTSPRNRDQTDAADSAPRSQDDTDSAQTTDKTFQQPGAQTESRRST